ncbi:MAG TPA: hypothetical protein VM166_02680 [Gemmatimonadaceae bacterium]|nr:hypothetical protein [Gemmatimonadaceae bacterium]
MSWPYAHLLINHFPVVLSVCALGASFLALILRQKGLWQAAMGALTVAGIMVYPVHFSGDKAEHALRNPWFIRSGTIEAHDDAARLAMIVILAVGLFAAYSWWRSLKRPAEILPVWMRAGVFGGALVAVATVTYTAYLGGKIIHEAPVLELKTAPAGLPPGVIADSTNNGPRPE